MKCSKCGTDFNGKFCPNCGTQASEVSMPKKRFKFKWWYILIAVVVLGVIGIALGDGSNSDDTSPSPTDSAVSSLSPNPLMAAEVKIADVMNGTKTSKIGERAYVTISKDELKSITAEEFSEFAKTRVEDSGYNWWTIIADDGTGIQFTGSQVAAADYGDLDNEGCITKSIGIITMTTSGSFEYETIE